MLRKSMVTLAVLAAMNAQQVSALGLGEVTVKSALNQPLNAEINLLQIRDLSKSQIIASLADADDFYLAGVKPTTVLSDINFQLDVINGKGVIRLSTSQPIREPFLNFLVEVNWPSGRLVREYTVLLDPPVFAPKDLSPRSAPMTPKTTGVAPAMKSAPMKPMGAPLPAASVAPSMDGSKYRVGKKDTLWDIALKTRPDRTISPQQMMMALQRMNPEAFVNNNINRLRSGVVLSVPNKQQILSYDGADAVAEVKRQNSAWKGSNSLKPKPTDSAQNEQLTANNNENPSPKEPDQEKAQLRIVSKNVEPEAEEPSPEDKVLSVDTAEKEALPSKIPEELLAKNEELEEQLIVTLEGLDKVERDNAELFDRLDKLSSQLESMQQLLTLKDQQMSDLQNKLAEDQAAVTLPPQAKEKSFIDSLLAYPAILGGAIAALLLALLAFFFIGRKRRAKDDDQAVEQAMAVLDERDKGQSSDTAIAAGVAAAAVASGVVAEEVQEDSVDEPESTPVDKDDPFNMDDDDLGDFDSLISEDKQGTASDDVNMDIDIEDPIEEDPEMAEFAASLMDGDEFNLAVEDDEAEPDAIVEQSLLEEELDIDDIELDETVSDQMSPEIDDLDLDLTESDLDELMDEALGEESEDLDFVLNEADDSDELDVESIDDISNDLDDLLGDFEADTEAAEEERIDAPEELDADEVSSDLDDLLGDAAEDESVDAPEELDVESIDDISSDLDEMLGDFDAEESEDESIETPAEVDAFEPDSLESGDLGSSLDDLLADTETLEDSDLDLASVEAEPEIAEQSDDDEIALEGDIDEAVAELDSVDTVKDIDLDVDLDVDDVVSTTDAIEDEAPILEVAGELDQLSDEDLENELDMALADEDNVLEIDETDLVEEETGVFDYLEGADEQGTKLDLARAYIDMDDLDGAREILQEVIETGNNQQVTDEAKALLDSLG